MTKVNKVDKVFTRSTGGAVCMVFEHEAEHPSQWSTIGSIAQKIGYSYCATGCDDLRPIDVVGPK